MLKLGYYVDFSDEDVLKDIISSYQADQNLVSKFEILIAWQSYPDYEESSFFLLRDQEGKLYENHGGHCSCYGFEGQFEPKETTLTYLKSNHFPQRYIEEVKAFVDSLE